MTASDAVKLQSFDLLRRTQSGSFDADKILRATLAVVDLDVLTPEDRAGLITSSFHMRETDRHETFKHARRRDSFVAGRLAAKLALRQHCPDLDPSDVSVENGVFDQPMMISENGKCDIAQLGVSISHSQSYGAALIFHRAHPMGIDVDVPSQEDVGPVLAGLDAHTRAQCDGLALSDLQMASLLWVARESLAKTLTTAMMSPLALYTPSEITQKGACFILRYENFGQYQTHVWPGAKGWLALTMPARTEFEGAGPSWW
ncbi:4'-phosphopantetheinyl transferase family protein [Thalassospira lucentensis]|uniref:4'-phosphopantetheinyl transferase family protein n=1 Tax=Thalassospira lucentensis TaxID=168935 RepID=UPI003D272163